MEAWHNVLRHCMKNGTPRKPSGVATHAVFDAQVKFYAGSKLFPAVTSKRLHFTQVAAELAAFLHGETTLEGFHKWGCKIWDANAANPRKLADGGEQVGVGRVYGAQWRDWMCEDGSRLDQLRAVVDGINTRPHDRRHILQAYNPGASDACLPACHMSAQFIVVGNRLNCTVTMRSCDLFLGLPFDVASYALLMNLMCRADACPGLEPGMLTFNIADAHIYRNHQSAVRQVLENPINHPPRLHMADAVSLWDFDPKLVALHNYEHCGNIVAPMNIHEEAR